MYHMCYDNGHLVLNLEWDIMLSFEKNQNFRFSVQKKYSAYRVKLFNGANSQLIINMVKAVGGDFNIAYIRFPVC